jgi:hypothetical protein
MSLLFIGVVFIVSSWVIIHTDDHRFGDEIKGQDKGKAITFQA